MISPASWGTVPACAQGQITTAAWSVNTESTSFVQIIGTFYLLVARTHFPQNCHMICETQCKMKMHNPLLKHIKNSNMAIAEIQTKHGPFCELHFFPSNWREIKRGNSPPSSAMPLPVTRKIRETKGTQRKRTILNQSCPHIFTFRLEF